MIAPIRIAQVGAGAFSRVAHGPALMRLASGRHPSVILAGLCDLDPTRPDRAHRFRNDFGFEGVFADFHAMIRQAAPDAIVCSVHPSRTSEVMADLLPYGRPVMTEKPQALSLREADRLTELANRYHVRTYVALNRRRMPTVTVVKHWVERQHGTLLFTARLWRRHRKGDFCLLTGIHAFDLLRYLAGEVEVIDTARTPASHGNGYNYLVHLQFCSGAVGEVTLRVDADIDWECYRVERGPEYVETTICPPYSDPRFQAGTRCGVGEAVQEAYVADEDFLVAAGIVDEHRAFLDAARGSGSDCTLAQTRSSLQLAIAAQADYSGPLAGFIE